jgi:hypothetical protein
MAAVRQKLSNIVKVNCLALSNLRTLIALFGNCALSIRICAKMRAKAKYEEERKETQDHLVEESMMTKKLKWSPRWVDQTANITIILLKELRGFSFYFRYEWLCDEFTP